MRHAAIDLPEVMVNLIEGEQRKPVASGDDDQRAPLREEELKSLSAFTDFIDTLNLDDLGKEEKPPPTETSPSEDTS